MSVSEFFFGRQPEIKQTPAMTEQQEALLNQLLGGLGGATGSGLNFLQSLLSGDTSQFEAPLMRQFEEEIIPGIAERFSGAGAGSQKSSAFQQSLGQAGAGLSERLGALRGGLQMQGLGQLGGFLGQGLGAKPFESLYDPGSTGFIGGLAPGIGSAIGTGLTEGMGKAGTSLFELITGKKAA